MGLPTATIVTDRLELRALVPEDAGEMASVLDDERLHDFTGGRPLSPKRLRARYERLFSNGGGSLRTGVSSLSGWVRSTMSTADSISASDWVI